MGQLLANVDDNCITYTHGNYVLHKLTSGAFQWGKGKDAQLVKSVTEVSMFSDDIKEQVMEWLNNGGYEKGIQEKQHQVAKETATMQPGQLEGMIMKAGGSKLLGQVMATLAKATGIPYDAPVNMAVVTDPNEKVFKASPEAQVFMDEGGQPDTPEEYSAETQNFLNEHEMAAQRPAIEEAEEAKTDPEKADPVMASLQSIGEGIGKLTADMQDINARLVKVESQKARRPAPKKKARTKPVSV